MLVLRFLAHHWIIITLLCVGCFVFVAGATMLDEYLNFKKAPTEPMFWCHKHGFFRKSNTLPLFPELGGTAENSHVCPTCYYNVVWKDVDKRLFN